MRNHLITEKKDILDIVNRSQWCHLAMVDQNNLPYVIPMNFGFRDDVIYMHGARNGKKISILKQNPRVCINFSLDHLLRYQDENVACSWSMKYRSILAYGEVEFMDDPDQKIEAMQVIMSHYAKQTFKFNPPSIREVMVWRVKIDRFEGRVYGY